jgi:hypothetical protein
MPDYRGPETNKCIDDGPPQHGMNPSGGASIHNPHRIPHRGPPPTRNPGEFRTEAEAKAEVERLRKDDPTGNFLIVDASPYHDLYVIARRGEVQEIIDQMGTFPKQNLGQES